MHHSKLLKTFLGWIFFAISLPVFFCRSLTNVKKGVGRMVEALWEWETVEGEGHTFQLRNSKPYAKLKVYCSVHYLHTTYK